MKQVLYSCLLLFVLGFNACKVSAPVITEIKSVDFKDNQRGKKGLEVQVQIKNPNNFALKLKKLDFQVFFNDKVLGKAFTDKKMKIARNSQQYYTIILETDIDQMQSLVSGFGSLLKGKSEFGLKGDLKCGVGVLPKRFHVEAKGKIDLRDFLK